MFTNHFFAAMARRQLHTDMCPQLDAKGMLKVVPGDVFPLLRERQTELFQPERTIKGFLGMILIPVPLFAQVWQKVYAR